MVSHISLFFFLTFFQKPSTWFVHAPVSGSTKCWVWLTHACWYGGIGIVRILMRWLLLSIVHIHGCGVRMNDRPTANVFFNNGEKCPLGSVINKFQHAKFLVYIIHPEDPPNEINSNRTSEKDLSGTRCPTWYFLLDIRLSSINRDKILKNKILPKIPIWTTQFGPPNCIGLTNNWREQMSPRNMFQSVTGVSKSTKRLLHVIWNSMGP